MSLTAVAASPCLGDQLQWNPLAVCEEAAQKIGRPALLVSYCSQAVEDRVDLWLVRDLKIAATPVDGLYEVIVSGICLYRSIRSYSSQEFPLPNDPRIFRTADGPRWFTESIDLAYVYVHGGGGTFRCLGKVLGLECVAAVESISLPDGVLERLAAGKSSGHLTPLSPLNAAPKRCPLSGR